jgi:type VI protein secretion system component VasK
MNSLSQWLWLTLWWFLIIIYLVILFQIIGDLFRDNQLSGWFKALWVIGLIIAPYLIALIYLIARGKGMAERQIKAVKEQQAATETYIRDVASKSPADHISDAKALLDAGTIDANEFAALKAKALA